MFDSITNKFSYREKVMLKRLGAAIAAPFAAGTGISFFTRCVASLLVIIELLGALMFELPQTPRGQRIDLNEWNLVWSDEFDGTSLDPAKWQSWYTNTPRRGGYWDKNQILVEDGFLKIRTEYKNAGQPNEGWYSGEIESKGRFEKKYGYFECRCICPGGKGLWAAFWTLSEGMFATPDGSAADGCEIDMFESGFYHEENERKRNSVNQAAGYDGYGAGSNGVVVGHYTGNNIFEEFNTYGLEWNENEIIFYINGVETDRLTGVWVPQVEQFLLLSVEVAGKVEIGVGGEPVPFVSESNNINDNDMSIFPLDFIVDYVRVYDKK